MINNWINVKGAKEHNLKDVNLSIPKNKIVVFTGVSGSGKSSLAFNTIYTEGRRKYIESLSSYARQFLGGSEKSNVDSIEGLSPSISIDQKTISHNPRSTVGTVTEIADFIRLLYSKLGKIICINGHGKIKSLSIKSIISIINKRFVSSTKITILSPMINQKKGSHKDLLQRLKLNGFLKVIINNEDYFLRDKIVLDKNKKYNIDLVVDRITLEHHDSETQSRLYEAIQESFKYSNKIVKIVVNKTKEEYIFSQNNICTKCGFSLEKLEPKLFSFNSPSGACAHCNGLGTRLEVDSKKLIPNPNLSIADGAITFYKNIIFSSNMDWQKFMILVNHYKISITTPINQLSPSQYKIITEGSDESIEYKLESEKAIYQTNGFIKGPLEIIKRRFLETVSSKNRDYYRKFMNNNICSECMGKRLSQKSLAVFIGNKNIVDLYELSISKLLEYIKTIVWNDNDEIIAKPIIKEIINRLNFLDQLGLGYLTLSRHSATLSGGEAQRIRLSTQIGSKLSGVIYVLDEPSIGLHQKDNWKLINTLKSLRDMNNTVIVVEHDEDMMRSSDWLVDIGPAAGKQGGEIVYSGPPNKINLKSNSLTCDYLLDQKRIEIPLKRRTGNGNWINIVNASENNLKNLNVNIPLNSFVCITGVSGSGKSTLINTTLYRYLYNYFGFHSDKVGKVKEILGLENLDKVINISQDPIGRTPRSNPATYTSVFDDIRDLYAEVPLSKFNGYSKGRFSFNVTGGRCNNCSGDGLLKVSMHFLPDVYIICEECNGKRYNNETLSVLYKNKSIADVLEFTVDEAVLFFANQQKIYKKLKIMQDVGLGYISLGQQAPTLSGGEAQRVKLATFLQKRATGKTLFILDEPTTGLHVHDIKKLLKSLHKIVDNGDSVIVIEHNLDVIKNADYIIDLGPEGGANGGSIVALGSPEEIIKSSKSETAKFLKKQIKKLERNLVNEPQFS